ncbi:MAG: endo-1,4-beta-xylanase [Kineosporiaceae bacterium]
MTFDATSNRFAGLDPRIRAARTANAGLTLLGADGAPLANTDVVVAQRDHAFKFGNIGFEFIPLANGELEPGREPGPTGPFETDPSRWAPEFAQHLADLWLDLHNFATLPFYWGRFEPERGKPDTQRILTAARWFAERGVPIKGHPLVWHTVPAQWLLDLDVEEVLQVQLERIHRDVTGFAGLIDMWDVINEVVIMPVFDKEDNGITRLCRHLGRIPLVREVFAAAREANPNGTFLLNDFDLSTAYECLLEGLLEAGVQIDVLGLQSHMHQGYWGEEKTEAIIERFARYGLPMHFTETTLVSGHLMPPDIEDLNDYQIPDWPSTPEGEARQADDLVRHLKVLLAAPGVEAFTYWGLADRGWLGAPGGLVREDGTPKPSYEAMHRLVKGEWWLPATTLRTDDAGRLEFAGFLGEYDVTVAGRTAALTLDTPGASDGVLTLS